MSDVLISKKNEVYIKLECEPHILYEIAPYFTFQLPHAKFMPQYRGRGWNGEIRLLSIHTGEIYVGLLDKVIEKLKKHEYSYEFVPNKFYGLPFEYNDEITMEGVKTFVNDLLENNTLEIKARNYQITAIYEALKYNRKLLLSPTSSGKSLISYAIVRYFLQENKKILIIVPTTSLCNQLYKDFEEYGFNSEKYFHVLYQGREKYTDKNVICSTWQSIYKETKKYFEQFDVVIGDECLSPETLIIMEDGSKKKIKDVKNGDNVLTFNESTKNIESKPVEYVHKNLSKNEKLYKLNLSNGNHIKITGNHKILLKNGVWKRADELKSGDIINTIE